MSPGSGGVGITGTAHQTAAAARGFLAGLLLSEYFAVWLSLACFAVLAPVTGGLASPRNLANMFSNMLPLAVVATGQTFVLIAGGIDLSVTSVIAMASVCGGLAMTSTGGAAAGIAVMLATGAGIGLLNGLSVTRLAMPPFMVTLTSMMFFSGLAIWLTRSQNIYNLPPAFLAVGRGNWPVLIAGAAAAGAHLALSRTLFGQRLFAVGMNTRAARVSGIPVGRVVVLAYLASGVCAAVASILYSARLETGSPVMGQRILLDVIAAAVIGGTSLFGGRGKVGWTLGGVVFVTLIDNAVNLMGLAFFMVLTVKGLVILAAALLDRARSSYAGR